MRLFGLIGYPLGHSFSEAYFRDKFQAENIPDAQYRNFPIDSIDKLLTLIEENPALRGLNVTIPYKQVIIPYMDELYSPAEEIGAVNTIKVVSLSGTGRKILKAYNTDVYGFDKSLNGILHSGVNKALVLGSGGASVAVKYVLEKRGFLVKIVSRKVKDNCLTYDDIDDKIMKEYLLIVNASPLGTYPDIDTAPDIPYNRITSSHILYDLVYNPTMTLFMKKGKEKGAVVKNGYQMLVNQAEKAWEIWNS
ncbi:MAG: shikimate dehydrogenase family protein [Bacteroidota bacterium]